MKTIRLTESDLKKLIKRIVEQSIRIDEAPMTKQIEPVPYVRLQNIVPTSATIKTNQNILKKLQDSKLLDSQSLASFPANDKNFLSNITKFIQDKGFTPYLSVNTDQYGNAQTVNPGITFSIPKLNIDLSVENGYFGVSKDLPFLKGVNMTASYVPGTSGSDSYGWGYKGTTNPNSTYTTANKFGVGLTIPIGK